MAIVRMGRAIYPDYGGVSLPSTAFGTSMLIDATGEKMAFIGRVWSADRTTKSIRKVGMRFGSVTKTGGSGLTLSLQDVNTAAGPPYQPDGTQDQTVAIPASAAATNGFLITNNLSADRSVAHGAYLAVVIEFDGSGRLGSDSFVVSNLSVANQVDLTTGCSLFTASWAVVSAAPAILFEFSDGTFGSFAGCFPAFANYIQYNYHINSSPADEYALEFQLPYRCEVEGATIVMQISAGTDVAIVVYDDADAIVVSTTLDSNTFSAVSSTRQTTVVWPPMILAANRTYRLSIKPLAATSVIVLGQVLSAASHLSAWPGGSTFRAVRRIDGGAWTVLTTETIAAGLIISGIDTAPPSGTISRVPLGM